MRNRRIWKSGSPAATDEAAAQDERTKRDEGRPGVIAAHDAAHDPDDASDDAAAEMGRARPISVGIVGGGVGGLTAALSLLRRGIEVHVYEQAQALGEVGAGVQVSPNAARVLHGLGLADELARTGVKPVAWHQRRWDDGRTLLRSPLAEPLEATFGFPHYQMHRADLLAALAGEVPAGRVHLGHRLTGLTDHGDRVEARFANGASVEVDLLVGADGIRSLVREELFGPEHPRFTGCAAYRGLVPAERLNALGLEVTSQVWMGPGRHFVHYFVSGGRLVNFVAVIEQSTWTRESWTDRGSVADALAAFAGWHPQVRAIIEAVDETFIWALFDRAPLERWSAGRVTLLGDACHPMLPFMAQGAAQAIEDGATLAACLAACPSVAGVPDVAAALRRYEMARIPRASRLQSMSATNKTRFHLPDGSEQRERDARMAAGATDWSFDAVAWIYEHDATVVQPEPDATLA
ncbi:MAG TPA: FAD-dependent monooxygenase [Streptosporangiaceae bacterium]|nr:FAD-dependent monooxygenase [Streptosporangiaceae bacterium]